MKNNQVEEIILSDHQLLHDQTVRCLDALAEVGNVAKSDRGHVAARQFLTLLRDMLQPFPSHRLNPDLFAATKNLPNPLPAVLEKPMAAASVHNYAIMAVGAIWKSISIKKRWRESNLMTLFDLLPKLEKPNESNGRKSRADREYVETLDADWFIRFDWSAATWKRLKPVVMANVVPFLTHHELQLRAWLDRELAEVTAVDGETGRDDRQPSPARQQKIIAAIRSSGKPLSEKVVKKKLGITTKTSKLPANLAWMVDNQKLVKTGRGYGLVTDTSPM